jgi:DNA-damage-inducible protein J
MKMSKTQTTIRIEEETYRKAKEILSQMGLNYSQAISVFNNMIVLNKGLPFELKLPNKETIEALSELERRDGKRFHNTDALFADLDS